MELRQLGRKTWEPSPTERGSSIVIAQGGTAITPPFHAIGGKPVMAWKDPRGNHGQDGAETHAPCRTGVDG